VAAPDVWTIGFVTGTPGGDVINYLRGEEYLSVYVPTTPNPTGGYFVMLRKSDCIELKMSVDDALKYVVSMGVVRPDHPHEPLNAARAAALLLLEGNPHVSQKCVRPTAVS
jgi:uncharacterized membrane protein